MALASYLTPRQLAQRWNKSIHTLRCWRKEKKGPPYIKLGGEKSSTLYDVNDIVIYEQKNKIHPSNKK